MAIMWCENFEHYSGAPSDPGLVARFLTFTPGKCYWDWLIRNVVFWTVVEAGVPNRARWDVA